MDRDDWLFLARYAAFAVAVIMASAVVGVAMGVLVALARLIGGF